ncbi:unnamed protein product, partial [Ectocarpus fasciculatus]
ETHDRLGCVTCPDCLLRCYRSQCMAPSNYGKRGSGGSEWMRDEVMILADTRPAANRRDVKGTAGHDRHMKGEERRGGGEAKGQGNIFTAVVDFFANLGKINNNNNNTRGSRSHSDSLSTPLTADDSGEETDRYDHDPGPLLEPGWGVRRPDAGGRQRRRASKPVAIKAAGIREPSRAQALGPSAPGTRYHQRQQGDEEEDSERAGRDGERGVEVHGTDEDKLKAWRQQRMETKRVSFTEERFVPCYATVTSNMSTESFQEMKYKAPDRRVFSAVAPPSSVARPNYHDALRR